jgi:hypothetical protein
VGEEDPVASNLIQHRGEPSVWDRRRSRAIWDSERWLATATAGMLIGMGVRRRSVGGLLTALSGAALAWWAAAGADERHLRRSRLRLAWPRRPDSDSVADASEQSFPASDAPSWTPTLGYAGPGGGADPAR